MAEEKHLVNKRLASHADIPLARHALLTNDRWLGRRDYVTSQKNVCVGG